MIVPVGGDRRQGGFQNRTPGQGGFNNRQGYNNNRPQVLALPVL